MSEGVAIGLMPDHLGQPMKDDFIANASTFDDLDHNLRRRRSYIEMVHRLIETEAVERKLRDAEKKITAMTQGTNQSAENFRKAIVKQTRRYDSTFSQDDIVEIFLGGLDKRLTSTQH